MRERTDDEHEQAGIARRLADTADTVADTLDEVADTRERIADTLGSVDAAAKREDAQRARDFGADERAEGRRLRDEWDLPPGQ